MATRNSLLSNCLSAALVSSLLVFCSSHLFAEIIIYDNNAGGAAGSDSASLSDSDASRILADDVTLANTTIVTGIQWTGIYGFGVSSPGTDDFTIRFYSNFNNSPTGSGLATFNVGNSVNRIDSGIDLNGQRKYEYSANINFEMRGNTTYWVSIFNDTSAHPSYNFFWGSDFNQGNALRSINGGSRWLAHDDRHDFRLTTVPEPTSFVMFGTALLAGARRRRIS